MTTTPVLEPLQYKLNAEFISDCVIHNCGNPDEQQWTEVRALGEGGQGTVYLERCETHMPKLRAVKKIPQQFMRANGVDVRRELHALMAVSDHEELFVRFIGWYEDRTAQFIYLAMEYVEHGDLGQYLRTNGPEAKKHARSITKQLAQGIAILHEKNICHRDLKPQNVLISSLSPIQIKLADFGVSKSTIGTDLRTRCGTANYMAPELLGMLPRALRPSQGYTTAVDIWALGCLVHEILTPETPFVDRSSETDVTGVPVVSGPLPTDIYLLSEFCKGIVAFPRETLEAAGVSESGMRFIQKLLVADPKSRMSAVDAVRDGWITGDAIVDGSGAATTYTAANPEHSLGTRTTGVVAQPMVVAVPEVIEPKFYPALDENKWPGGRTRRNGDILKAYLGIDKPGQRTKDDNSSTVKEWLAKFKSK